MKKIQPYIMSAFELWKRSDKIVELEVNGVSMEPLVRTGDRISVRLINTDKLRRGDIFVFWQNNDTVVHRFIKKRQKNGLWQYCEKGDNCTHWTWVGEQHVLGRVEVVYKSNHTLNMLKAPWPLINYILGFLMLIWVDFYEIALVLKRSVFGHGRIPVLSGLRNRFGKVLNIMFMVAKMASDKFR